MNPRITFVRAFVLALLLAAPLVGAAGARAHAGGRHLNQGEAASRTFDSLSLLRGVSASTARAEAITCTAAERDLALREDQQAVRGMLLAGTPADLTTLDNEADLAALAALGYGVYPHQQTSFGGMGWDVYNLLFDPANSPASTPSAGHPPLLLYEPSGENVYLPRDGFDVPYRLRGWVYLANYDFGEQPLPPLVPECIARESWFVHERGLHPFETGGMEPRPPDEEVHGTAPGRSGSEPLPDAPGDIPHTRVWSLHVWLDGNDVPSLSILNPGAPIRGIEPSVGVSPPPSGSDPPAFYYPPRAADLSLTAADSPDPVHVGQKLTYTITVTNHGPDPATGVSLTVVLPRQADSGSATASQGRCSAGKTHATCDLGGLAVGSSALVSVVVRPIRKGTATSTVSVTANEMDLRCVAQDDAGCLSWTRAGSTEATVHTTVLP